MFNILQLQKAQKLQLLNEFRVSASFRLVNVIPVFKLHVVRRCRAQHTEQWKTIASECHLQPDIADLLQPCNPPFPTHMLSTWIRCLPPIMQCKVIWSRATKNQSPKKEERETMRLPRSRYIYWDSCQSDVKIFRNTTQMQKMEIDIILQLTIFMLILWHLEGLLTICIERTLRTI